MDNIAIKAVNLNKDYRIYKSAKEKYLDFFLPKQYGDTFTALNHISFEVEKGTTLALIGLNGSGKSTLAQVIAGASSPTRGTIETKGKVLMTALAGGLSLPLTGKENIIQKGLLLGLSHKEIQGMTNRIIEFSELGSFITQPVNTYSSGMRSKLAFAISINIDPDIFIIDEALSVGDPTFTQKCLDEIKNLQARGKTMVLVSHSMAQVREFCDRAIWLEGGIMKMSGTSQEVTEAYEHFIKDFNASTKEDQKAFKAKLQERQMRG